MQYLIEGKLIAIDVLRMPHAEFVQLVHAKVVPSLKLLVEAIAAGTVLAGGYPAASRQLVFIVDMPNQNTHRVVRSFLQTLPFFEFYDWEVTSLETFAESLRQFEGS